MYRDLTVAVVVPAYNEAGFVGQVIAGIPPFVDRAYVVNDGSTDDTWEEIQRHAKRVNADHRGVFDELVVPIRHETNRGVGGAIKTGYRYALEEGIDATAVLGGDDQMDAQELPRYLDPIADSVAGYAKGNRFSRPGDWADMPRFRLLGNVVLSYLTKVASGYWDVMDSQNGYTVITGEALEQTDFEEMYEYYGYCNDLLVRLNVADVRVADVPRSSAYAYSDGWKSHIEYSEYVPRVSMMLLAGFFRRLRSKYLLGNYHPLAGLYLVGIGASGFGLLGLFASIVGRSRDSAGWFLATVLGVLTLFRATELDHDENEPLVVRVDPETPSTDRTAADAIDRASGSASSRGSTSDGSEAQRVSQP